VDDLPSKEEVGDALAAMSAEDRAALLAKFVPAGAPAPGKGKGK
jgi:hypothetical protein